MNIQRVLILAVAAIAAGGAALLARGLLGGGTPKVVAAIVHPTITTSDVLVASSDLEPGQHLTAAQVRWQKWPRSSLEGALITRDRTPNVGFALQDMVVRAPIVAGEPITDTKIVRTDAAGLMAANVTPGMRAMSINVTVESGAGGFILPNDRVDVILAGHGGDGITRAITLLSNIRVLALDQTLKQDGGQKVIVAKTATLEVSPAQAEALAFGQAAGTLTLVLRGLADSTASSLAATAIATSAAAGNVSGASVAVIRYGLGRPVAGGEH